jgi:hypothetical protein
MIEKVIDGEKSKSFLKNFLQAIFLVYAFEHRSMKLCSQPLWHVRCKSSFGHIWFRRDIQSQLGLNDG